MRMGGEFAAFLCCPGLEFPHGRNASCGEQSCGHSFSGNHLDAVWDHSPADPGLRASAAFAAMNAMYALGVLLAAGLFVYLLYALLKAERF